jgi:hypothetical protein
MNLTCVGTFKNVNEVNEVHKPRWNVIDLCGHVPVARSRS